MLTQKSFSRSVHNTRMSLLSPTSKVWGKVMFSEACVKNSVHRGGGQLQCMLGYHPSPWEQTLLDQVPPPTRHTPPDQTSPRPDTPPWTRHSPDKAPLDQAPSWCSACWKIWSTSGWYASYWNAILLPTLFWLCHLKPILPADIEFHIY